MLAESSVPIPSICSNSFFIFLPCHVLPCRPLSPFFFRSTYQGLRLRVFPCCTVSPRAMARHICPLHAQSGRLHHHFPAFPSIKQRHRQLGGASGAEGEGTALPRARGAKVPVQPAGRVPLPPGSLHPGVRPPRPRGRELHLPPEGRRGRSTG